MMENGNPDSEDAEDVIEESRKPIKELGIQEKLSSGYCAVGEHQTKERLYLCKHCKRTYCLEHGDEEHGYCNECIIDYNIQLR